MIIHKLNYPLTMYTKRPLDCNKPSECYWMGQFSAWIYFTLLDDNIYHGPLHRYLIIASLKLGSEIGWRLCHFI